MTFDATIAAEAKLAKLAKRVGLPPGALANHQRL
jgi:hypothetical protein